MSRNGSGPNKGVRDVLEGDEVRRILRDTFFAPTAVDAAPDAGVEACAPDAPDAIESGPATPPDGVSRRRSSAPANGEARCSKPRPEHYKVICISLYTQDLERLDAVVTELKRRGFTKANRSAVLRVAMDQLDLDRVPKGL